MKAICKKFPKTMQVLGFSGSGKDTQIDKLSELCGYEKISTGKMFREEYERGTEMGLKAFEYWGKGKWNPDEMVYEMFPGYLKQFDPRKPWIFSQVTRSVNQISLFDELLAKYDRKLEKVVYFFLSEEVAIERMSLRRMCPKCGDDHYHLKFVPPRSGKLCDKCSVELVKRPDDEPRKIRSRIREFHRTVDAVVDVYRKRGILIEIDASPSIEEIHQEVVRQLAK